MHARRYGLAALVAAALVTTPLVTVGDAGAASKDPCGGRYHRGSYTDFNNDGVADAAIAAPNATVDGRTGAGVVVIAFGLPGRAPFDGPQAVVRLASPQSGDHFGASLAVADIDGDCRADLVIGIPGLDAPGATDSGGIAVVDQPIFGGPDAVTATLVQRATLDIPQPHQRLGQSLDRILAAGGDSQQIVAGEPGATVKSQTNAGAVLRFGIRVQTSDQAVATNVTRMTQGNGGVPGHASAGANFGAVVQSYNADLLSVSAPGYPVNGKQGAGAVDYVWSGAASRGSSCLISKASRGVPGRPHHGEHFGSALAGVFIGAPDETVDGQRGAGAAYELPYLCQTLSASSPNVSRFTQDSARIPGSSEAGDHFGAALNAHDFVGVAAPGESFAGHRRSGVVDIIQFGFAEWRPGVHGFRGLPRAGSRFGSALAEVSTDEIYRSCDEECDPVNAEVSLIGAPGAGSGRVYVARRYVLTPPAGLGPHAEYGAAIASGKFVF